MSPWIFHLRICLSLSHSFLSLSLSPLLFRLHLLRDVIELSVSLLSPSPFSSVSPSNLRHLLFCCLFREINIEYFSSSTMHPSSRPLLIRNITLANLSTMDSLSTGIDSNWLKATFLLLICTQIDWGCFFLLLCYQWKEERRKETRDRSKLRKTSHKSLDKTRMRRRKKKNESETNE